MTAVAKQVGTDMDCVLRLMRYNSNFNTMTWSEPHSLHELMSAAHYFFLIRIWPQLLCQFSRICLM